MFSILEWTVYISLLIQFITGAVGIHGLMIPLSEEDKILREVLIMEMVVQLVEFIFYIWLAFGLFTYSKSKNSNFPLFDVTKRRYIDWFITTPTMLLSTIIFLQYIKIKENKKDNSMEESEKRPLSYTEFIKDHKKIILLIILSNAMMLLFGYLVENGKLDKFTGISIGFIFLLISFYLIYKEYAIHTEDGKKLFFFMFIVWSLYGVAAIFPFYIKNISYNMLDVFAKNFFGLFLYVMILRKR
jgi:bacteriorhodopsin